MHDNRLRQIIFIAGVIGIFIPNILFASTSTNYTGSQERGGPIDFSASSTNYKFDSEVGHPAVGRSTSTNYIYDHGAFWAEEELMTATIQWAVPELRVGPAGSNDDVIFYLSIRSASTTLFTTPLIASTTASGTYNTPISLGSIPAGTYDIGIKGHQHLTRILRNVVLHAGNNVLNFSQTDFTSTTKGSVVLLAGDVNGAGVSTSTLGDDKVNAVDLTAVLAKFNNNDPDGNSIRENINQDTKVNALDLTIVLKNFNAEGDQ